MSGEVSRIHTSTHVIYPYVVKRGPSGELVSAVMCGDQPGGFDKLVKLHTNPFFETCISDFPFRETVVFIGLVHAPVNTVKPSDVPGMKM